MSQTTDMVREYVKVLEVARELLSQVRHSPSCQWGTDPAWKYDCTCGAEAAVEHARKVLDGSHA